MTVGRLVAVTCVALVVAVNAARAQGASVEDQIRKGTEELNNLNYSQAADIGNQVLRQGASLTRQQRIAALQLIAAAMYPEEAGEQHADSASRVIRRLVELGVTDGMSRDISWRGLDSLYTVVARATPAAPAGRTRETVTGVLRRVEDGQSADEIADRASVDCYTFSFADLEAGLRRARASVAVSDRLKRTCTLVVVESDPPNASVAIAKNNLGTVPPAGASFWVDPQPSAEIVLTSGGYRVAHTVALEPGKMVQARFTLPTDTVPWPVQRSSMQIAQDLNLFDRWTPSTPRPAQPVKPSQKSTTTMGLLGAVLGAAGGFAAGQLVSSLGCVSNYTVPAGEVWKVNGTRYAGGEKVNLGKGSSCVMTVAGGSAAGMFVVSSLFASRRHRSANTRYAAEARAYPSLVSGWEDRERRAFAERNPDVQQAAAADRARLEQVQSANAAVRARNVKLTEPQVQIRDLRPGEGTPPSTP